MKYSLSDYILSIKCNDETMNDMFGVISIGGEGSYTDSISITMSNNLFDVEGYATGAYVVTKNLSKVGSVDVTLSQLSSQVSKFRQLCNMYYGSDYGGLTLTLTDADGQEIASCIDCFPQKIPNQEYGNKAANQTWSFVVGKVTIN